MLFGFFGLSSVDGMFLRLSGLFDVCLSSLRMTTLLLGAHLPAVLFTPHGAPLSTNVVFPRLGGVLAFVSSELDETCVLVVSGDKDSKLKSNSVPSLIMLLRDSESGGAVIKLSPRLEDEDCIM